MTVFDPVAENYDSYRPGYPDELYATIESYAGAMAGLRIVDLAAGTGIGTRSLVARGASVIAVDPGAEMLRVLRARSPVPAVRARGEALPFADATVDVVTCATAWHWIDAEVGAAEVRRVLRPGGTFALWWGFGAAVAAADRHARTREQAVFERWRLWERPTAHVSAHQTDPFAELPDYGFVQPAAHDVTADRVLTPADHIKHLQTHSSVLGLAPNERDAFLAELHAALDGYDAVTEQIACHLVLVRRP